MGRHTGRAPGRDRADRRRMGDRRVRALVPPQHRPAGRRRVRRAGGPIPPPRPDPERRGDPERDVVRDRRPGRAPRRARPCARLRDRPRTRRSTAYLADRLPLAESFSLPVEFRTPWIPGGERTAEERRTGSPTTCTRRRPASIACSRPCCSPTSSTRPRSPRSWVMRGGGRPARRTTAPSARTSLGSAGGRSRRWGTGSWPRSTDRRGPCAARRPSRRRCAPSASSPSRLHTGEVELVGDDVAGLAVAIAARVPRWPGPARCRLADSEGPHRGLGPRGSRTRASTSEGRPRPLAPLPGGGLMERSDAGTRGRDDVSIAYQVVGEGPIDLVVPASLVVEPRLAVGIPIGAPVPRAARFVHPAHRCRSTGWGCSDRVTPGSVPPLEVRSRRSLAVLDAADPTVPSLFGAPRAAWSP